jgi:CheY-like chemotaxis protein
MMKEPQKFSRRPVDLQKITAIVIAEQNATTSLLAGQLRALKVTSIHSFINGDEAVDRLAITPRIEADIVVLEWAGEDQAELMRRLRRVGLRSVQEIPVIAILARADMDTVLLARDSGVNAVLARPLSAAQLLDKLSWAISTDIPFIRSQEYIGPDRRRFRGVEYDGQERRGRSGDDDEHAQD